MALSVAQQRIGARASTASETRLLVIKGAAVLTMYRTVFYNSGVAVEYG